MKNCKLSKDEQQRRKELATHVREMICEQMPVEASTVLLNKTIFL